MVTWLINSIRPYTENKVKAENSLYLIFFFGGGDWFFEISLSSPGSPGTYFVEQSGLGVLGLTVCATMLGEKQFKCLWKRPSCHCQGPRFCLSTLSLELSGLSSSTAQPPTTLTVTSPILVGP